MDIKRVRFLREVVVTDAQGRDTISLEFSYDSGVGRAPYFLAVPVEQISQARSLYHAWGGSRQAGERVGTTVRGPWIPSIQSKGNRSKNGDS